MKKTLCAVLALLMLVTVFAGCSSEQKEKEALLGTWKADLDLADLINETLAEDETTGKYFVLDEFTVTMVATFREDDTYTITIDEASMQTAFDHLMEVMEEGIVLMLEDEIAASGLQITVEQMLALGGTSLEAMMEEMEQQFEEQGLISQITEEAATEGKFRAKEGKLYTSEDVNTEPGTIAYDLYTLEENVLTLTEHEGSVLDTFLADVYPIRFEKAA